MSTLASVTPDSAPRQAMPWLMAIRPKTLTAGAVPVAVATGLAFGEGRGRVLPALAALVGALLIQIGTNLVNDYYDFIRGADDANRVGPVRVTQAGLLRPEVVLRAALVFFGLAMLVGLYLVTVGGWPVVAIGLLSLVCGYAYTGGPFPLGYHGLGDVLVMLFFGFIAVGGTYYVQTGWVTPAALWAGLGVGALGTALIVVNNVRDRETDVRVGKRTMAVRLGPVGSRVEYFVLLGVAFTVPCVLFKLTTHSLWLLLPLLSIPLAWTPARRMAQASGAALNAALGETARLQLAYGALLALGLWQGIARGLA